MYRKSLLGAIVAGVLVSSLAVPASASAQDSLLPAVSYDRSSTPEVGNVTLAWNAAQGAARYKVELYVGTEAAGTPVAQAETTALSWSPTNTLGSLSERDSATYTWRVGAIYSGDTTVRWSEPESFTRASLPATGQAYSPTGTVTYPTSTLEFLWPLTPGAKGYKFEHATNPSFASVDVAYSTTSSLAPTFVVNRLTEENKQVRHYWRVTPLDGATATASAIAPSSDVQEFTLDWPNSAPIPTYPTTTQVGRYNDLRFEWLPVSGAKYYKFELSDTPHGAATHVATLPTNTYTPKAHLYQKSYFWRVTPYDSNNQPGQTSTPLEVIRNWGSNTEAEYVEPLARPELGRTASGINWANTTAENPAVLSLGDLELAWKPVPRAGYYQVEVSAPANDQSSFYFDGKRTCITPNTRVTPMAATASATGASNRGSSYAGLLADCLIAERDPSKSENYETGKIYAWRVVAFDNDATSSRVTPRVDSTDAEKSLSSEFGYFTIDEDRAPVTDSNGVDNEAQGATSQGTPHVESASPRITWADHESPITRVRVRLAESTEASHVVTTYVYGSNSVILNGVIGNNTTSEPYRWDIAPCTYHRTNGYVCSTTPWNSETLRDPSDSLPVGTLGRFTKHGPTLTFDPATVKNSYSTEEFTVGWQSWAPTHMSKGGSAGYAVQISLHNDPSAAPVLTEKVETNSWQYAQGVAANTSTLKLVYGEQYRLRVAPLDALGNPGTYNEGFTFTLKNPSAPGASATVTSNGVTFRWNDMPTAVKYAVSYALEGKSTWTQVGYTSNKPSLTQRAVTIPRPSDGEYKWRIQAVDRNNAVTEHVSQPNFTVSTTTGAVATSPASGTVLSPTNRKLSWNGYPGAARYKVLIAKNGSNYPTASVETVQTVHFPIGTGVNYSTATDFSYAAGAYKWKVLALNEAGVVIADSAEKTFSVENPPTKPSLGKVLAEGTTLHANWSPLTLGSRGTNGTVTYEVRYREVTFPESSWKYLPRTANDAGSASISGLKRATTYEVSVRALNAIGASVWSDTKTVKTADVPGTPVINAPSLGVDSISLSWANTGPSATSYEVKWRSGSSAWKTAKATSRSFKITNLNSSTTYSWEVRGLNDAGYGPAATGSSKTLALPGVPTKVVAKAADKSATVTWTAPSAGSKPITAYVVETRSRNAKSGVWSAWKISATTSKTQAALSGLANGTNYQVRVSAKSTLGKSAVSASASFTPAGKPLVVKPTVTSPKKKHIKITWKAATANGSAITKYTVQVSLDGKKWTTVKSAKASTRSFTWKKAKSGKNYRVRLSVKNGKGTTTSTVVKVKVK